MRRKLAGFGLLAILAGLAYDRATRSKKLRADEEVINLPEDPRPMVLKTSIGEVTLCPATGYYDDKAIYVFLPEGRRLTKQLANAFSLQTDGRFQLEASPSSSQGGNDEADAIISAGIDYCAFLAHQDDLAEGYAGYFKDSPAPTIDEAADALMAVVGPQRITLVIMRHAAEAWREIVG